MQSLSSAQSTSFFDEYELERDGTKKFDIYRRARGRGVRNEELRVSIIIMNYAY
jgi:hypothetical protein